MAESRNGIELALRLVEAKVLTIDEQGLVWRHMKQHSSGSYSKCEPKMINCVNFKGYYSIHLQLRGVGVKNVKVHRLIWELANGPIPEGMQINHKDFNKANNKLENLELVTNLENSRHARANGCAVSWSKATVWRGKPRVTKEEKVLIQAMRKEGMILKDIAAQFNLSIGHVWTMCKEEP
jgi:hypothetical protein